MGTNRETWNKCVVCKEGIPPGLPLFRICTECITKPKSKNNK